MAGVLIWITWNGVLPSHRLKFYLIAYGLFRFATEMIRPEPVWAMGMTFYQWAALILAGGLALQWAVERRRTRIAHIFSAALPTP
jgi:prolipoprotein diacylglyceryltransferase